MALRIPPRKLQYSLTEPSHRFQQGGRNVYYFALDLGTLDGLLPQRVEDDVVREANRRLTRSHAKNIQRYLDEKDDWLLGSLMLGIASDAVEFDPYPDERGGTNPNFGELRIRTDRLNTMRIFDGQHRRRAIQDILLELTGSTDNGRAKKLEALRSASMTIVLYVEDEIKTLRQMFVDASKTKPIEGHTVTRFDRRDAFSVVAVRLAENSRMLAGRVDMERSTVLRSSRYLLAVNQLATILKSLEVGYGRRVSRTRSEQHLRDIDVLYDRCIHWADVFVPSAREEYGGLLSGDISDAEIPQFHATSFAYEVTFFRLLAGCFYQWTQARGHESWEPLADFIHRASIDRGSGFGLLVDSGLVDPSGRTLFSRRQEMARVIEYIVNGAETAE